MNKAFALGIALNIIFVALEVIYGLAANSSALLADAGHNTSDVLSLIFAWAAIKLANRKPQGKYTYGLRRTTILVSILNSLLLFGAVFVIGWDAIQKLQAQPEVAGTTIMIVAGIGVVINGITALLFVKGQKEDLNIKGAFLHMAADAGVSLGVVVAGLLIRITGYNWIDPIISFVIVTIILYGTWSLFIDSINLALDAVPKNIDLSEVYEYLLQQSGVQEVHDLHIWAMSTTDNALTAHLVMPEGNTDEFLFNLRKKLDEKFGINHTTIQVEKTFKDTEYKPYQQKGSCHQC
ncbi:MAG: cation diffusion facilitator family transporter [Candidatus Cyclobacteriaceae bacterium M3_2C_046]